MRVIVDTDLNFPSDDSIALNLMLVSPEVEVVAVTSTWGNTWSEEVEANVRRGLCDRGGRVPPLFRGPAWCTLTTTREDAWARRDRFRGAFLGAFAKCERPRDWETDGGSEQAWTAPMAITTLVNADSAPTTILCLGPLTNIAEALRLEPSIASRVARVLWSGGNRPSVFGTPDFNSWFDAEAVQRVLDSGLQIDMLTSDEAKAHRLDHSAVHSYREWLYPSVWEELEALARQHGWPVAINDVLAALALAQPSIVAEYEPIRGLGVLTQGSDRGRLVCDAGGSGVARCLRLVTPASVREVVRERFDYRRVPLRPRSLLHEPHVRYAFGERLDAEPLWLIEADEETAGTSRPAARSIGIDELLTTGRAVSQLLVAAKLRGEIWPPIERIDCSAADQATETRAVVREVERFVWHRLERVSAICLIRSNAGDVSAFNCISRINTIRSAEMQAQFGHDPLPGSWITEFGFVVPASRGLSLFAIMNRWLIDWASTVDGPRQGSVYGVVLSTQAASRASITRIGYQPVTTRVIDQGFEAGRSLTLFRFMDGDGS